jgi:predicted small metal-binding protein
LHATSKPTLQHNILNNILLKGTYIHIIIIVRYTETLACRGVGLDCDHIIKGTTEVDVIKHTEEHYSEIHAIEPEEMTSEMKAKIKDNIHDDDV